MMTLNSILSPAARRQMERELTAVRLRAKQARREKENPPWVPNPGPQTMAYHSEADILGYGGAAGGGKALALDTPLPTPTGWTTMAAVAVGDWLFDEQGGACRVTAVSGIMLERPCYELLFSDGSRMVADADHKWVTMTVAERAAATRRTDDYRQQRRKKREWRGLGKRPDLAQANEGRMWEYLLPPSGSVRTTQEIVGSLTARGRVNHSIDVAAPLKLGDSDLPIAPYVLGAWLGDGSSYKAEITTADAEILAAINETYATKHRVDYTHGIYGLLTTLKSAGLLANKHIPAVYLRGGMGQRLALLQGLMDTDGYCDKRGQCEFTTTSRVLADGVYELLGTLGIKAAVAVGRATLNGRDCGVKYRIKFMTDLPAFRLGRKLARQKRDGFRGTHGRRYILEARPVATVPVKCVAVDSPSHLYLAGRAFIPTHNTDLLLGLARTQHHHSVIFRRVSPSLRGIIERSRAVFANPNQTRQQDSYNETLHRWKFSDGRQVELESCQHEKDKEKQRGRPRDFYGFDEVTEMTRSQVEFIIGWLRSTIPGQRTRVVMTFNPPEDSSSNWIVDYFLPWLAYLFPDNFQHPNPAAPGELRWFATLDGREEMFLTGEPFEHNGELVEPLSRTFIPAKLDDNPYLRDTTYRSILQATPEPLRSQLLYGDFAATATANPFQVVSTASIRAAQKRWLMRERPSIRPDGAGLDVARDGRDKTVYVERRGNYIDEPVIWEGFQTPDGPTAAALVHHVAHEPELLNVDVIGYGSSAFDSLVGLGYPANPVNVSVGSDYRDKSGRLKMRNLRAELVWRLRDALDPESGVDLALPPGKEVVADLACYTYKPLAGGAVLIEEKEEIKKRIGRSPDVGDAILLALYDGGVISGQLVF